MADDGRSTADLTATERADIDGMSMLLEGGTLYELLKVADNVDRRTVRDAYFRLSKQFHPDAFYGRNLGKYREKLEAIFRALTGAYDVLSNKNQRAEYDRTIGLKPDRPLIAAPTAPETAAPTQSVEASPSPAPARPATVVPSAVAAPTASSPIRPPGATQHTQQLKPLQPAEPVPGPSPTSGNVLRAPGPAMTPPSEEQQRAARDALARKLAGSRSLSQSAMPAVQPPVSAAASLQSQFSNRPDIAQRQKVEELRASVRALVARGDFVGASNTVQILRGIFPDDKALEQEALELQRQLLLQLAPKHTEAAREAERSRQFAQAAALWGKVAAVKPEEFEPNYRLGRCLLATGKELARAADAARKASAIAPRRVEPYLLLAEVFELAGKPASAKAAVEQAAKVDPTSLAVKDFLARLR
jgi:hypothetical protein